MFFPDEETLFWKKRKGGARSGHLRWRACVIRAGKSGELIRAAMRDAAGAGLCDPGRKKR